MKLAATTANRPQSKSRKMTHNSMYADFDRMAAWDASFTIPLPVSRLE